MLFPTLEFAIFFIIVFAVSWEIRDRYEARKLFLLGASYFFYGFWDWRFLGLLALSSGMNYAAGLLLSRTEDAQNRRLIVGVAVALNLSILGFFKYYGFFLEELGSILINLGIERDLPLMEIILPVGISFFTFQGISYVVDVYRREVAAVRSPIDLFLYISFFPQLVAGPIVRARDFLPQLEARPRLTQSMMAMGLVLIIVGLFKKMVIANYLATELADHVFFDPSAYGTIDLTIGLYAYAVQIYCDFSGYSDIAIGVAALLGYRFQRNFNQPYRAASLQEFWRRWHISLSQWLRDYLYKPLGGSRGGALMTARNLFLTMVLGGIWHGAAWTFIIWGVIHGTVLVVERWVRSFQPISASYAVAEGASGALPRLVFGARLGGPLGRIVGVFVTFHVVCLAWIFFRSQSLEYAVMFLDGLSNWGEPVQLITPFLLVLVLASLVAHFLPDNFIDRVAARFEGLGALGMGVVFGTSLLFIEAMSPEGVAPFIYFQF